MSDFHGKGSITRKERKAEKQDEFEAFKEWQEELGYTLPPTRPPLPAARREYDENDIDGGYVYGGWKNERP